MKLVSVDRASKAVPYVVANTNTNGTGTLRLCKVNFTRYGAYTKQLAGKKGYHFVALLKLYLLIQVALKLEFAIRSYQP